MHCFTNITVAFYVVSLPDYDTPLFEDTSVNQMQESLKLFEDFGTSRWFGQTLFVLVLNKVDVFREKAVAKANFGKVFSDYKGR